MKNSRFSEEQIIGILKPSEAGAKTNDLCRQHGISAATFYGWRSKYGGMEVSEAKRLKQLEEENSKLKRIVAEQALDLTMLKDLVWKEMVSPEEKRSAVAHLRQVHGTSERRACGLVGQPRSSDRSLPSQAGNGRRFARASAKARGRAATLRLPAEAERLQRCASSQRIEVCDTERVRAPGQRFLRRSKLG